MRGLLSHPPPSALFGTLRHDADPRTGAASAPRHGLLESPPDRRGLLSGILESVGGFLGFGNNQADPGDPKDTDTGSASSTGGTKEPTKPSPPAQAPPESYPVPGGGGQADKPTSSAPIPPASVSSASSSSAGTVAEPAPHSTSPPAAINVVPAPQTAPLAQDPSQSPTDTTAGASRTIPPAGWPSISPPVNGATSSASSPTDPPTTASHAEQFPLPAAAAIGAVLGFLVVSALFWAVWLSLRKRRRVYPEFASVHPKRMLSAASIPIVSPDPSANGEAPRGGNPFTHPRDEREDDPFDAASFWRASSARSTASTLSV